MTKAARLALIRERAAVRPALSPAAAEILDGIKKEDSDLGGNDFGALAADELDRSERVETEDENEENVDLISPLMRGACEDVKKYERELSKE